MVIAYILFFLSAGLIVYSYALYPILLQILAKNKKLNQEYWDKHDDALPFVLIFCSAYNEQSVIAEKIKSVFNSSYPGNKIRFYIGSDNSTDRTNEIIEAKAEENKRIIFRKFEGRNGKSNILNAMLNSAQEKLSEWDNSVIVMTDANVMFSPDTIYHLAKHFKNPRIGQVGANIVNKGVKEDGISFQEKSYIQRENKIKFYEGIIWGSMMGAFGACHAIRPNCWKTIPPNFLMEDFYLSMNVLSLNLKAIKEMQAVCYEDVSNEVSEEVKRKTRIQAGNFQNLKAYYPLLLRFNAVSFCFFSHKVIRWFGPLLILFLFISNLLLVNENSFFRLTLIIQFLLLLSPLFDWMLKKTGIHFRMLRFIAYFYMMNFALLKGMIMFFKGIKTNVWQSTQRNV